MTAWTPWYVFYDFNAISREIQILVGREDRDGNRFIMPPPVLAKHEPGTLAEPTFTGDAEDMKAMMQAFLDTAWKMGLRPNGFEGPQELKAVNRHLEDMRKIAFQFVDQITDPDQ